MKAWHYLLAGGLTLLPSREPSQQRLAKPDIDNGPLHKIVYVGATQETLPQPTSGKRARLHEFLDMLHAMPNLVVAPVPQDSTSNARSSFYPEDPVLGVPNNEFRVRADTVNSASTHHGRAQSLIAALKRNGYQITPNLAVDIDGGDVLYDSKRGIFLVGGTGGEAQQRADALYKATGHYAVPVVMVQPYTDYAVPTASGLVETPPLFYHLDTFTNTLPNGELLIYPQATDAASLARIKTFYKSQYMPLDAVDASRYISNLVSSVDVKGKPHLLLPAVSHALPFSDHTPLRTRLLERGYEVHSPEQKGYTETHAYPVNLFDGKSDFIPSLHCFINHIQANTQLPDLATLKAWAAEASLELEIDRKQLVLRNGQGQLCALPVLPNKPITEEACTAIIQLQAALVLNTRWRAGKDPKEALARVMYPDATQSTLETIAAFDNLPYFVMPENKERLSPYIFSGGGPECMTLEVLSAPSPQQEIAAMLNHTPNDTERQNARAIATAAGMQIRFNPISFELIYADGAVQKLGYGQPFEQNMLRPPRTQSLQR